MARASKWQRYRMLRDLITRAVEEANDNTPEDERTDYIFLAVSPDLSEVIATYKVWWDDDRLSEANDKGWFIDDAPADDPESVAELYFDLR